MRVERIYRAGYAIIAEANDGKEQFTVLASSGQNGWTNLTIVRNRINLGPDQRVMFDGKVRTAVVGTIVGEEMREWHRPNEIGFNSDVDGDVETFLTTMNQGL